MFHSFSYVALVAITIVISSSIILPIEAKKGGFTAHLIHRDFLKSPYQLLKNAFQRSEQRSKQFASTEVIPSGGEYLMKISYGTPPVESLAIVDTGSHLVWVQCLPCINCYKENFPPFNPKTSSSFQFVSSNSVNCPHILSQNQSGENNSTKPCPYDIAYGDGSYSSGDLATETITFGHGKDKVSFPNFIFGCGHDNAGQFSPMESGLVGLGPQKLSLVSQLNKSLDAKFSYCLVPLTESSKSSKLSFGDQAKVSGPGVVSSPLLLDVYYSLTLEHISVGRSHEIKFSGTAFSSNGSTNSGSIIIDSGTTLTYLPEYVYGKLKEIVQDHIKSGQIVKDPQGIFSLCYSSLKDADIPKITFHFKGADLELNPINTFVKTSPSSSCLAFTATGDIPIFGNIAQANFLVGYDLVEKTVSFKQVDCTKL
ncbi:hypothetical protein M9H77_02447 [Catharanthus roseus]|uniref:Uncharacterized protein n=1 Tax=Catharanthus roseus TaxID=4058 RepID=A0ACC0C8L0_CATRO|nr:hypothetical protein M9H77_02447 [Catharanthus roseus]